MKLSAGQLEKFKQIYEMKFGIKLNPQEALDSATQLIVLMQAIYRPIEKKDLGLIRN